MKKIVLFAVCLIMAAQVAYAHDSAEIRLNYDKSKGYLEVVVSHNVSDPEEHFIERIIVKLNDILLVAEWYDRQDNEQTQTKVFPIADVKAGDIIFVEAYCNMSGKLSKTLKIK